MLKSYVFVETEHQKLHDFVIAFFDRIENEVGAFSLDFFEADFRPIVKRHRVVLKNAFSEIYSEMKKWSQEDRSQLCEEIRQSNNIERICTGHGTPRFFSSADNEIYKKIKALFSKLYSNVLDGGPVHDELGVTLRQHFDDFRKANKEITLCPMCGICELKTEHDIRRDQYDHYLPQACYPLSSVNFHNLIPTCKECNSFDAKGEKDIVAFRANKLFYPYDENHQGIDVYFSIQQNDEDNVNISWDVRFESCDDKDQEVEAWKQIYNIEERYLGFVKGRINKWYKAYWEYLNADELLDMTLDQKNSAYFVSLKADEAECLNIIRRPALKVYLEDCRLNEAKQESLRYSLSIPS